jgi:aspartate/methionine/tyrosine aminotransferase
LVKELIRQKHIMVVHGSGFGQKPGTQHFRMPDEKTLTLASLESQTSFRRDTAGPESGPH